MEKYNIVEVTEMVKSYLRTYEVSGKKVVEYVDLWERNKKDLIDLFGGNLILERSVELNASFDAIKKDLLDFSAGKMTTAENKAFKAVVEASSGESLLKGIFDAKVGDIHPSYKPGMKMAKVLTMIASDAKNYTQIKSRNISRHEYLGIELSKLQQNFKKTGFIALSIHPLDFFTVSINKNNWSSCHSPGGAYAAGMASYMFDKVSAVAYFHSGKAGEYDFGTWNSKAWRQMVHIDIENKTALFSRQYPRIEEVVADEIRTMVEILLDGGDCVNDPLSLIGHWYLSNRKSSIKNSCKNIGKHYPDLVYEYACTRIRKDKEKQVEPIVIGYIPPCPDCFKDIQNVEHISCCCGPTCHNCGDNIGDDVFSYNGSYFCEDCRDELFFYCDGCDEWHEGSGTEVRGPRHTLTYCEDCLEGDAFYCNNCNLYFSNTYRDSVHVHGLGAVCNICLNNGGFTFCDGCGLYHEDRRFVDGTCSHCGHKED